MLVRSSPCRLSLADGSSLLFAVKALSQTRHVCKSATECHIAFASNQQILPRGRPGLAASGEPSRCVTFRAKTHLDVIVCISRPPLSQFIHTHALMANHSTSETSPCFFLPNKDLCNKTTSLPLRGVSEMSRRFRTNNPESAANESVGQRTTQPPTHEKRKCLLPWFLFPCSLFTKASGIFCSAGLIFLRAGVTIETRAPRRRKEFNFAPPGRCVRVVP